MTKLLTLRQDCVYSTKLRFNICHVTWWSRAWIPTETKDRRGNGQKVCVRVCAHCSVFTTDVDVSRFYRMGIHLTADGKHQSQAGDEKVCLGRRPAAWRQRKQKSIPGTLQGLCWLFELFSVCKAPVGFKTSTCCCVLLQIQAALLLVHSWDGFRCRVHTCRDLAGAGELQDSVEWQFFVFVRARKLGSNDANVLRLE